MHAAADIDGHTNDDAGAPLGGLRTTNTIVMRGVCFSAQLLPDGRVLVAGGFDVDRTGGFDVARWHTTIGLDAVRAENIPVALGKMALYRGAEQINDRVHVYDPALESGPIPESHIPIVAQAKPVYNQLLRLSWH